MVMRFDISSASLLLGIAVGAGLTLAGAHSLPRTMMPAPAVGVSGAYAGVDDAGVPALCDSLGRAYDVTDDRGIQPRWIYQPPNPDGSLNANIHRPCKAAR